jgi:hypothetical protein
MSFEEKNYMNLNRDICLEILGYKDFEMPYGRDQGYVLSHKSNRWEPIADFTKSLNEAVSLSNNIIDASEGRIVRSELELPCSSNRHKYSFKYIFHDKACIAFESNNPCEAICNLSLYIYRNILKKSR